MHTHMKPALEPLACLQVAKQNLDHHNISNAKPRVNQKPVSGPKVGYDRERVEKDFGIHCTSPNSCPQIPLPEMFDS